MDQGVAAVVAAGIAFCGVGVGLLGARWQSRGALRQAEATVQAALKQSEAAVTAVIAQARHENEQWRRGHRRDIWLEFHQIVDDFGWKISECRMAAFHRDPSRHEEGVAEMRRLVDAAFRKLHQVEFESPGHIATTARVLVNNMDAIKFSEDRATRLVAARSALSAIDESAGSVAHAAALECREIIRRRQVSEGDLLALRLSDIPLLSDSQRFALIEAHANRDRGRSMREFDLFVESYEKFKKEARSHLDGE
ncbi:hypothetical protein [Streptomyces sp. KN37]|uniref:hypothetical protein n=1 Tax=Streptomyces sp. KN37 TaxID=3090667 RepID=UPI002A756421|nr:hypothetical protein [Streptomyces sp. KN37]WPO71406.1 hypothetical protein R9806_12575 [Streptomyces sp. KN37]